MQVLGSELDTLRMCKRTLELDERKLSTSNTNLGVHSIYDSAEPDATGECLFELDFGSGHATSGSGDLHGSKTAYHAGSRSYREFEYDRKPNCSVIDNNLFNLFNTQAEGHSSVCLSGYEFSTKYLSSLLYGMEDATITRAQCGRRQYRAIAREYQCKESSSHCLS